MKENEFLDGVSNIESDIVERFVAMDNKLKNKSSKSKIFWLRFGVVAACFLLIVGVIIVIPMLSDEPDPYVPYFDPAIQPYFPTGDAWSPIINSNVGEVVLSANEVGKVFGLSYDNAGTNQYRKIYAPTTEKLGITPLPDAEYLPIYSKEKTTPSKALLNDFITEYWDSVTTLFEIKATSNEIKWHETWNGDVYYEAWVRESEKRLGFYEQNNYLRLEYYNLREKRLKINGERISILESDTDVQIQEKLKDTIDYLCTSLGKEYTDIMINREYSDDQLTSITVHLYSSEETILPPNFSDSPKTSNYISLIFYTDWGSGTICNWGGTKDEAFLTSIEFSQAVKNCNDYYKVDAKAKMLTLKEAEELLKKGYVFGGHTCPICMAKQPEVDFSTYTCVDIEYISDRKGERIIPFYAFYKYIGQNRYGMNTFAKTYVPAIEVSGYEEYFESQKSNH